MSDTYQYHSQQRGYAPQQAAGFTADGRHQSVYEESPILRHKRDHRKRMPLEQYQDRVHLIPDDSPRKSQHQQYAFLTGSPARSADSTASQRHQAVMYGLHHVPLSPKDSASTHRHAVQARQQHQRLEHAGRRPNGYHVSMTRTGLADASKSRRQSSTNDLSPVVFGTLHDSGSVMTGLSQQELLMDTTKKDSKANKRHRKTKKARSHPIVNIPMSLSQGLTVPKANYGRMSSFTGSGRNDDPSFACSDDEPRWYKPNSTTVVDDDVEHSTDDSTRSPDCEAETLRYTNTARLNSHGTSSLYSSLPAQQPVLKEADAGSILLWTATEDTEHDMQSIDSFPILSKHCGFSLSGLENVSCIPRLDEGNGMSSMDLISDSKTKVDVSVRSKRTVRFSHQDSHLSLTPWEEHGGNGKSPSIAGHQAKVVAPPTSERQPKSILRAARISPAKPQARTSTAYYAQIQAFRDRHLRRIQANGDRSAEVPTCKSPPRQASAFADIPQSPSKTSPSLGSRTSALKPNENSGHKKVKAFQEILMQANKLYHDASPIFPEDDDGRLLQGTGLNDLSHYSSLGSDVFVTDNANDVDADDKTNSIVAGNFIQTIAAVVIQTAFRRYRIQWIYSDMLARKRQQKQRFICHHADTSERRSLSNSMKPDGSTSRHAMLDSIGNKFPKQIAAEKKENVTNIDELSDEVRLKHKAAATKIQSLFRGYWARDCISVDSYCATLIQKNWRSNHARHIYLFELYSIIVVQSLVRRNLAREHAAITLYAITLIQKTVKGFLARNIQRKLRRSQGATLLANWSVKKYATNNLNGDFVEKRQHQKHDENRRNRAAVAIQKEWRRFRGERMFIESLVNIITVQTLVRRWIADRHEAANHSSKLVSSYHSRRVTNKAAPSTCPAITADYNIDPYFDSNLSVPVGATIPKTRSVIQMWQQRSKGVGESS